MRQTFREPEICSDARIKPDHGRTARSWDYTDHRDSRELWGYLLGKGPPIRVRDLAAQPTLPGVKRDFACTFTRHFHLCSLPCGHSHAWGWRGGHVHSAGHPRIPQ
jgi:hypothetical protein